MRNKQSFIFRLRIASQFLFNKKFKNSRIMTCGKCKSTNISSLPNTEKYGELLEEDIQLFWTQQNKCNECGAWCEEMQIWKWDK